MFLLAKKIFLCLNFNNSFSKVLLLCLRYYQTIVREKSSKWWPKIRTPETGKELSIKIAWKQIFTLPNHRVSCTMETWVEFGGLNWIEHILNLRFLYGLKKLNFSHVTFQELFIWLIRYIFYKISWIQFVIELGQLFRGLMIKICQPYCQKIWKETYKITCRL